MSNFFFKQITIHLHKYPFEIKSKLYIHYLYDMNTTTNITTTTVLNPAKQERYKKKLSHQQEKAIFF